MENSSKDPFEQLRKDSEKRKRKFKFTGKVIGYLYLALFFGACIFMTIDLWGSIEWIRIAGILLIVLVVTFILSIVEKKFRGIEKSSTSSIYIGLLATIIIFISIYIFFSLTSKN